MREFGFAVGTKIQIKMENSTQINMLKVGDIFKRKSGAKKTFERGAYCRENKAFECVNLDDINEFIYLKKGKIVVEIL